MRARFPPPAARAVTRTGLRVSYLHETVISTLVAGMLPVNGSNS